ncbi:AAA family ATPase [Brevundimonas nasdae]|nr:AAA family ATPase [Brevundimonas nasdae]
MSAARDFDVEFEEAARRVEARRKTPGGAALRILDPVDDDGMTDVDLDRPLTHFVRPFRWRDPKTMPRRQWLYGGRLIRKFVSATFAPGGVGKSALSLAEAMSMASGKPILNINPRCRLRVGYWNGEDPFEETERRTLAAAILHDMTCDDLEGWLHLGTGREDAVTIAEETASGSTIMAPNVEAVIDTIRALRLDVVILDPFVSTHRVNENDNNAIDRVVKQWARIADQCNVAIELVHHTRKTNGADTTVEDGRGAGALVAGVRNARVLNPMSQEERERAGVPSHEAYFRVEAAGKANLTPPSASSTWYRIANVDLGNEGYADDGVWEKSDGVGAVHSWSWPDAFDGVSAHDLLAVQRRVDDGQWRENPQASEWVGKAVAEALELDLDDKVARQKVKSLIATWIKSGALVRSVTVDEHRKERPIVEVGKWAEVT